MKNILAAGLLALAGCEQKLNPSRSVSTYPPLVVPVPVARAIAPPARPGWAPPASIDTLVRLNRRPYRLRFEAETDSTQPLTTTYTPFPGHTERARGYEGRFTFTLRDSTGRQVFRRQLRKADFFAQAGADIVVESEALLPSLLGYSVPLGALIFTLDFAVPNADVGSQVVLLLDLTGKVLRMSEGRGLSGGADCDPVLAADGRTLLTPSEILRPNQPPLRLNKPDADLAGAFLLSDTTLLAVYAPGKTRLIRSPDGLDAVGRTPNRQQLQAPNAFVRHTRSGRVLHAFRYGGFYEELGYTIPQHYLRATATCYLLDEKRGLHLLPRAGAAAPIELRFAVMPVFVPPQKPAEVRFELQGSGRVFAFYVDTTRRLPHIRYQRLAN